MPTFDLTSCLLNKGPIDVSSMGILSVLCTHVPLFSKHNV